MRDARQYLRSNGSIEAIRWQDVIQLDPALDKNPTHKAHIVADLAKWQNTAAGQKMLVSLKDAQSRIPNSEHWNSPSKFVLTNPSDSAAYHRDLAAIEARHTD